MRLVQTLGLSVIVLSAGRASAEPFLDLYGGVSQTESTRVSASRRDCSAGFFATVCSAETSESRNVAFDPSATYGVRGGYWISPVPWFGVAGDLSHFEAKNDDARFRLTPLSLLIMARLPLLATHDVPRGRLQPYVGLGPSLIYEESKVDFRPEVAKKVAVESLEVGLDVRAGVAWQFHPRLAVFTEYRFTHVSISADDKSTFHVRTERVDATLNTHHLLGGVSIRF